MIELQAYLHHLRTKEVDGVTRIFCHIRRRWMVLTPEESVRQTCLLHLMDLGYAHKQIAVEKSIKVNTLIRRFDILVYDRQGRPYLLVECKAPAVRLSQTDLDQMSAYQYNLNCQLTWLTNGHTHHIHRFNAENRKAVDSIPKDLIKGS